MEGDKYLVMIFQDRPVLGDSAAKRAETWMNEKYQAYYRLVTISTIVDSSGYCVLTVTMERG